MSGRLDAIVIGGGVGGLAAAVVLAGRGRRVHLVEASDALGGKLGTAEHEGVVFDTGPSILTVPEALRRVFAEADVRLEDVLGLRRLSPTFRYRFPGGAIVDFFDTLEETLASVRDALGPAAADELRAYAAYAAKLWERTAPVFVFGPAPAPDVIRRMPPAQLLDVFRIDATRTMWGAIEARVKTPELRAILQRYATYNGSDARRAPGTLNCIGHVELGLGGHGVEGGMIRLAEALAKVAREKGAVLETGARVAAITTRGRRKKHVTGVALADGRRLEAPAVVSNAETRHLFDALLERPPREAKRRRGEPSTSGWNAIVKARANDARASHNVLFPARYRAEFEDLFDRGQPPSEPTVYACDQRLAHGRSGWADGSAPLFLMVNAPAVEHTKGSVDWPGVRAKALARARAAGLVHADDEVIWERRPEELARRFPGSSGSLYGSSSSHPLSAFLRPPNRIASVPGLYVASGTAHPGGGVPLCAMSGLQAAKALLADRA
ncbi:MAG: phytoene desaturase family protein [Myxococcota bacterium]